MGVRTRLAALIATLEVAGDGELDVFAGELVEMLTARRGRARRDAVAAAARLFCRLPSQARSAAVCVAREALTIAASELPGGDQLSRCSIAALAAATGAVPLCRRLPGLLLDPDQVVAAAAEQAINDIAAMAMTLPSHERAECEQSLLEAIGGFDRHRRRGVLLAGLRLLGTPSGLAGACERNDWVGDASHPAHLAIRALLRRGEGPEIARTAMVWLRVPAQASVCRERLQAACLPAEQEVVLRHAHLLAHPARRLETGNGSARSTAPVKKWLIDVQAFAGFGVEARRQLSRWTRAHGPDPAGMHDTMDLVSTDPSPVVRLGAIVALEGPRDPSALLDLVYDEDASVARSAALRLLRRRGRGTAATDDRVTRAVSLLMRSAHPGVRAIAHAAQADQEDMDAGARMAWRNALRRDRAAALAELRDRVLMGSLPSRAAWIGTCRAVGAGAAMEREFCEIAEEMLDADASGGEAESHAALVLAATAVAALGDGVLERADQVLQRALCGEDARIAANAIEAIARRARRRGGGEGRDAIPRLIEFKDAPAHRVRANAALTLLRCAAGDAAQAGADAVVRMLGDDRTEHRLAGLWLADRAAGGAMMDAGVLIEPVTRLRDDPDAGVKGRAIRCRRRIGVLAGVQEVTA